VTVAGRALDSAGQGSEVTIPTNRKQHAALVLQTREAALITYHRPDSVRVTSTRHSSLPEASLSGYEIERECDIKTKKKSV
jgi:hypothetical protein